jgi:hypothetical protein
MTAKRKRAVSTPGPSAMVSDEKSEQAPSLPDETAAASSHFQRRGWFGMVLVVAVYVTASLVAQLLLDAWWRLVERGD